MFYEALDHHSSLRVFTSRVCRWCRLTNWFRSQLRWTCLFSSRICPIVELSRHKLLCRSKVELWIWRKPRPRRTLRTWARLFLGLSILHSAFKVSLWLFNYNALLTRPLEPLTAFNHPTPTTLLQSLGSSLSSPSKLNPREVSASNIMNIQGGGSPLNSNAPTPSSTPTNVSFLASAPVNFPLHVPSMSQFDPISRVSMHPIRFNNMWPTVDVTSSKDCSLVQTHPQRTSQDNMLQ